MLVGQVVKTFGALDFMNFEIENYVRYKTFQIGKNVRYKKIPRNLAYYKAVSLQSPSNYCRPSLDRGSGCLNAFGYRLDSKRYNSSLQYKAVRSWTLVEKNSDQINKTQHKSVDFFC